ncbi:MAG: DUF1957 domain-containing protein [Deltaproteobacteria bacterium]|nr:DUF1957 domain-containing protein [Deltaproteobacteria bacterium]
MVHGSMAIVLHAHLPWVRHPEHEHFLEEEWLYEAVTEAYLPLVTLMRRWADEGVPFKLSLSLSPTLVAMLQDELLRKRCDRYLEDLSHLVDAELKRTAGDGHLQYLAGHYRERLDDVRRQWQALGGELVPAFARLQEQGHLDLMTCAATHAYLPLHQTHPQAVWAQLKVAVDDHRRAFGRDPVGIWLPECAYYPGLDALLADAGLRYFVGNAHALTLALPPPRFGTFAPVFCDPSGVAVFGRDLEASRQVWSRDDGYPSDPTYREFYRDIGFDLDLATVGPFLKPDGVRKYTGIKYHRITGATEHKELYDPYWAREKAAEHAADFALRRRAQLQAARGQMDRAPLLVAPYDAELFGHWWYEGPWWLDGVVRRWAREEVDYPLTHLADYLRGHPNQQLCRPAQSSWGEEGYHQFWLNAANEWLYPHLHKAAERMVTLAQRFPRADGLPRRALNQAARELLLAQSSDWAFILRTGTMVDYAARRVRSHLRRFTQLYQQLLGSVAPRPEDRLALSSEFPFADATDAAPAVLDEAWLSRLESADTLFPTLDYRVFRGPRSTP